MPSVVNSIFNIIYGILCTLQLMIYSICPCCYQYDLPSIIYYPSPDIYYI